jgi:hypothetical protein
MQNNNNLSDIKDIKETNTVSSYNINTKKLSGAAYTVLSDFTKNNIIFLQELVSHDGYDKYGPESNLWDLYIIVEINNDYIYYYYHWEDWYRENQDEEYDLYQPGIKLSETTRKNINLFKKKTKDTKFNEAFGERLKLFSKV